MVRVVGTIDIPEVAAGSPASGSERFVVDPTSSSNKLFVRNSSGVLAPAGFGNPMTTAGDIIVAGASGAAGRLAKGSNSRVLAVDSGGTIGWVQATRAMLALASTTRQAGFYQQTTNWLNGYGLNNTQEVPIQSALGSFTVLDSSSQILFCIAGGGRLFATGAGAAMTPVLRLYQSGTNILNVYLASSVSPVVGVGAIYSVQAVVATSLTAGSYNWSVQLYAVSDGLTLYMQPGSTTLDQYQCTVLEMK